MLEGNEFLSFSSESGYRLCKIKSKKVQEISGKSFSNLIQKEKEEEKEKEENVCFSCVWDINERNAYFLTSSNGFIQRKHLQNQQIERFEILFSKFSLNFKDYLIGEEREEERGREREEEGEEVGRHCSLHWDKMRLIPGRPGEVLFLLGITQSLYYSAFPGSSSSLCLLSSPSLSTSNLDDEFIGYTYGTPVTEILTHNGRITTLEVSSCGTMLATGDENGIIKLLMICRPQSLQHTLQKKSFQLEETINFQCQDLQLRNGIQIHIGPIFSIHWIAISTNNNNNNNWGGRNNTKTFYSQDTWLSPDCVKLSFYLVTGSNDGYIKM